MTTTENVDSQKWYKFLLDKNEMNVIINSQCVEGATYVRVL